MPTVENLWVGVLPELANKRITWRNVIAFVYDRDFYDSMVELVERKKRLKEEDCSHNF